MSIGVGLGEDRVDDRNADIGGQVEEVEAKATRRELRQEVINCPVAQRRGIERRGQRRSITTKAPEADSVAFDQLKEAMQQRMLPCRSGGEAVGRLGDPPQVCGRCADPYRVQRHQRR